MPFLVAFITSVFGEWASNNIRQLDGCNSLYNLKSILDYNSTHIYISGSNINIVSVNRGRILQDLQKVSYIDVMLHQDPYQWRQLSSRAELSVDL